MLIPRYTLSLLLLLAAGALVACEREPNQSAGPEPVPVTVATVTEQDAPVQIKAIGTGEAYNTVTIKPRISGQVAKVDIHEGEMLHINQPIFTIDQRPFQHALEQPKAAFDRDTALAVNAQRQADREEELFKQKLISPADYDQAKAAADAAKATVELDNAAIKSAQLQLDYCSIASPINGQAGSLMVDIGNDVKLDDTAMLTINQVQPINVTFSVPEQYLGQVQDRLSAHPQVRVTIPAGGQPPETGKLVFVDNQVDSTTGTIRLKGEFENKDLRLWPGQYLNVELVLTTQPHAIVVPSQAIQPGQQGPFVFVVKKDDTVEARNITPGRNLDGQTIVNSGLRPGERVVTDGQVRLVPGAKVEVREAAGQPATTRSAE